MAIQKSHQEFNNIPIKRQLILMAENIRTPENMGMIFRVGEAFGVEQIIFTGTHGIDLSTKAKRASRSTYQRIQFSFEINTLDSIIKLQNQGYFIIALEITKDSKPIQGFKFSEYSKIALIVGSERNGISEEALKRSQQTVHIPLYGHNSSINVVSALSIALQEITRA